MKNTCNIYLCIVTNLIGDMQEEWLGIINNSSVKKEFKISQKSEILTYVLHLIVYSY